jgi:hypothetical protein
VSLGTIALIVSWCIAAWHLKRRVTLRISTTSLLFGGLLLIHGLPLLSYLYVSGPDSEIYEAALASQDRNSILDTLQFAVALMFVCITLGSYVASNLFPGWAREFRKLGRGRRHAPIEHVYVGTPAMAVFFVLVILALAAVAVIESQPAKIVNYYSSPLSMFEQGVLRANTGGSAFYLYNLFVASLGTFVTMVAFTSWKFERGRHFVGLIAATLIALLWMAKVASLMKSPPVMFLLQFLALYMIMTGKTLSARTVFTGLAATIALSALVVKLTFAEFDASTVFGFLYYRLLEIPNEVLLEYFAAIPNILPYEWGSGLFGFLKDQGGEQGIQTYFAVAALTRGNIESSSNAMFIADAWAQFSWMGVALMSFLAGGIARSIDLYAFGRGFTDESAVIVASCAYGVLTLLATSLPTAIITGGLGLIPLLSFIISGRASSIVKKIRHTKTIPQGSQ